MSSPDQRRADHQGGEYDQAEHDLVPRDTPRMAVQKSHDDESCSDQDPTPDADRTDPPPVVVINPILDCSVLEVSYHWQFHLRLAYPSLENITMNHELSSEWV